MRGKSQSRIFKSIRIRCDLQPGDIGKVIALHGIVYASEHGYDHTFEGAYVARSFAEFVESYNPRNDRLWVAEKEGQVVGSIGIVGRLKDKAQLRWWLVHPRCRGLGLGKVLLEEAIEFCKTRPYKTIYLWTVNDLAAAIHLYKAAGFQKTEEKSHPNLWGRPITEERYELHL
ncbi:MAG: GNAT family N-acetyltransferase [Candidatus Heimdallarchaeota archaeon]